MGEPQRLNSAKEHFDLGEALGQMDFETAAAMSGARFVLLKGQLARLERALACFMLDLHTTEFGYTECAPPLMVRDEAAFGTGQLPKFKDDLFTASDMTKRQELLASGLARADEHYASTEPGPNRVLRAVEATLEAAQTHEQFWLIPTAEVSSPTPCARRSSTRRACRSASRRGRPASGRKRAQPARIRAA